MNKKNLHAFKIRFLIINISFKTLIDNYYVSMCVKSREVIKQFPPQILIHLFAQSMRHHKKVMFMLMSVHITKR